ncbi:MAG: hypothetical protein AAGU11_12380, partial [Syntrophobacteraceae bacterium]
FSVFDFNLDGATPMVFKNGLHSRAITVNPVFPGWEPRYRAHRSAMKDGGHGETVPTPCIRGHF